MQVEAHSSQPGVPWRERRTVPTALRAGKRSHLCTHTDSDSHTVTHQAENLKGYAETRRVRAHDFIVAWLEDEKLGRCRQKARHVPTLCLADAVACSGHIDQPPWRELAQQYLSRIGCTTFSLQPARGKRCMHGKRPSRNRRLETSARVLTLEKSRSSAQVHTLDGSRGVAASRTTKRRVVCIALRVKNAGKILCWQIQKKQNTFLGAW